MKFQNTLPAIVVTCCCAIALSGCASYDTNKQSLNLARADIVSTTFKPNYEVEKMAVSATAQQKHFLFFSWGDADLITDENLDDNAPPEIRRLKKAAVTKACIASDCDLLVGSTYQFERTGFLVGRTVKCTVRGFPAHVVSVEEIKPAAAATSELPVAP